jgi:hypothetical protein
MNRLILAVLAAAPLVAAAQDPTPAPEIPRLPASGDAVQGAAAPPAPPGVFIGAGLGTVLYQSEGPAELPRAMRIRVGAARSSRLLLGVEGGLIGGNGQLQFYDVGATFFPWEGAGFFVRGALGMTTDRFRQGPNALAGLGWTLGGRRGWNLSLNVEAQAHRTGDWFDGNQGTNLVSGWIGLDWY